MFSKILGLKIKEFTCQDQVLVFVWDQIFKPSLVLVLVSLNHALAHGTFSISIQFLTVIKFYAGSQGSLNVAIIKAKTGVEHD